MKTKHWIATASVAAFVALCSFKATNKTENTMLGKVETVQQEKYNKMLAANSSSTRTQMGMKHTTITIALFVLAMHTPAYGQMQQVEAQRKSRMVGLDSSN